LLQKGKVCLHINYGVSAHGYKIFKPDEDGKIKLVHDGRADVQQFADRMKSDAVAMAGGARLYPVR
jgi:hypothetical protein